jgi:sortase A
VRVHAATHKTAGGTATAYTPVAVMAGSALALIEIPKIGVKDAVVEGTTDDDLRKGPGHYAGSAQPGQLGNVAIAGHRTTYGAPFGRLNELQVNDEIFVTTGAGRFRYVVSKAPFVVLPTQREVVAPTKDAELTLTTCHPRYQASHRLIVQARLEPLKGSPLPATTPASAQSANPAVVVSRVVKADATVTGFHLAAAPASLLWGLLLLAGWLLVTRASRQWSRQSAWILATPVLLVILFEFFLTINHFLPSYV